MIARKIEHKVFDLIKPFTETLDILRHESFQGDFLDFDIYSLTGRGARFQFFGLGSKNSYSILRIEGAYGSIENLTEVSEELINYNWALRVTGKSPTGAETGFLEVRYYLPEETMFYQLEKDLPTVFKWMVRQNYI